MQNVRVNLRQLVTPSKTILVVWDVQRMLVNSIFNREEFLKNLNLLLRAARAARVRIVFTRISPLPPQYQSPVLRVLNRWGNVRFTASDLALAVNPMRNEVVIDKSTTSIFIGTNFEYMARNVGATTLIFTGIATEIGVESSARDAYNRGFLPIIVEDAVSSSDREAHERSLANMRKLFLVVKTQDLINAWGVRV